jgi:alkanesulfonate monooxygenase SsuD/methylene tetrahydromethanopterin reductase-like flavin-dependent oxidoreductase (luciferase family)
MHPPRPVGIHSLGYVAQSDEQALTEFWPHYLEMMTRIGRERGFRAPNPASYAAEVAQGSLYVGAPLTVARRISETLRALGASRFDLKYGMGNLAHERLLRSIELYGEQVVPMVREMIAEAGPALASTGAGG